jgi:hypothetical protein
MRPPLARRSLQPRCAPRRRADRQAPPAHRAVTQHATPAEAPGSFISASLPRRASATSRAPSLAACAVRCFTVPALPSSQGAFAVVAAGALPPGLPAGLSRYISMAEAAAACPEGGLVLVAPGRCVTPRARAFRTPCLHGSNALPLKHDLHLPERHAISASPPPPHADAYTDLTVASKASPCKHARTAWLPHCLARLCPAATESAWY